MGGVVYPWFGFCGLPEFPSLLWGWYNTVLFGDLLRSLVWAVGGVAEWCFWCCGYCGFVV